MKLTITIQLYPEYLSLYTGTSQIKTKRHNTNTIANHFQTPNKISMATLLVINKDNTLRVTIYLLHEVNFLLYRNFRKKLHSI